MSEKYDLTETGLGSEAEDEQMTAQNAKEAYISLRNERRRGKYVSNKKIILLVLLVLLLLLICGLITWSLTRKHYTQEKEEEELSDVVTTSVGTTIDPSLPWAAPQLPGDIVPSVYNLTLRVDLSAFTFNGSVIILVKCVKATSHVILHAARLEISPEDILVALANNPNETVGIDSTDYITNNHYVVLKMGKKLDAGVEYLITFQKFGAAVLDDVFGLYRSSYQKADGTKSYLAITQLEAVAGRTVFPCFDEPRYKATFNIKIEHQPEYISLSNMPVINSATMEDGWILDIFDTTPVMSLYLFAVSINDFKHVETNGPNNLQINIWAPSEWLDQTEYAKKIAPEIYNYFTEFFDMPEQIPKADHIAIPDMGAEAMENWGLVTYETSALLIDGQISSNKHKYYIAQVMSHEIAHTWFGNIVTMEWWSDLWLNEAFATLGMYMCLDNLRPDWKVFDRAVSESILATVFVEKDDALLSSHPISVPISHADEIVQYFDTVAYVKFDKQLVHTWRSSNLVQDQDALLVSHPIYFNFDSSSAIEQYFDKIAYIKGSHVLRMLTSFMGAENFKNGMQNYIKKYQFRNAKMEDLWNTLEESVDNGLPSSVGNIMNTWLKQMGYPVVTVTNSSNGDLILSQEYFLLNPEDEPDYSTSPYNYKWEIPFTFTTSEFGKSSQIKWLDQSGTEVKVETQVSTSDDFWIVGNFGSNGYYLVNYYEDNWHTLAKVLQADHTLIDGSTRLALLNSAFMLARASKLDYMIPFKLCKYLNKERNMGPWKVFLHHMKFIMHMLSKGMNYGEVQKYMLNKISPLVEELKWTETGDYELKELRIDILNAAIQYNDKSAIQYANNLFEQWKRDPDKLISANFRELYYRAGVREGGEDAWQFLFDYAQASIVAGDRHTAYAALAASNEPWLLQRYLNIALNGTILHNHDFSRAIVSMDYSMLSRTISYYFLMQNWDVIQERFGSNPWAMDKILPVFISGVNTNTEKEQLEEVFGKHPASETYANSLSKAINMMRANIYWTQHHADEVGNLLREFNKLCEEDRNQC